MQLFHEFHCGTAWQEKLAKTRILNYGEAWRSTRAPPRQRHISASRSEPLPWQRRVSSQIRAFLFGSERAILFSPKESTYVHQIRVSGVGTVIGLLTSSPVQANTFKLCAFDFVGVNTFQWCVVLPNLRVKYLIILWNKDLGSYMKMMQLIETNRMVPISQFCKKCRLRVSAFGRQI